MNANEKRYARAVQKLLFFEAGLAVAEMPQSKLAQIHERALQEYNARLAMFNPLSDDNLMLFSGNSFAFTVREHLIEDFKKEITNENVTGKKFGLATGISKVKL